MLVLDSGAVTRLSERTSAALALVAELRAEQSWPPVVPAIVLVECLQGHAGRDAIANRFLKGCTVLERVPEPLARRAAWLRARARAGSAVDALVVAAAEPSGTVLTSDPVDLEVLAPHATDVTVVRV